LYSQQPWPPTAPLEDDTLEDDVLEDDFVDPLLDDLLDDLLDVLVELLVVDLLEVLLLPPFMLLLDLLWLDLADDFEVVLHEQLQPQVKVDGFVETVPFSTLLPKDPPLPCPFEAPFTLKPLRLLLAFALLLVMGGSLQHVHSQSQPSRSVKMSVG